MRGRALVLVAVISMGSCAPASRGDKAEAPPAVVLPTTAATVVSAPTTSMPTTTEKLLVTTSVPLPPRTGAILTPTGIVVAVVGGKEGSWLVRTPCERQVTISEGTHIETADVVIDPGHGGSEPGAVGPAGVMEKTVNLGVAKRLADRLQARGLGVVMTRTGDYRVTLKSRAEIAKRLAPKFFVSIHFNAEPDGPSTRPGTETYYQLGVPSSKRLAGLVYEEVVRMLEPKGLSWVADTDAGGKYRTNVEGRDYYGILRHPAPVTTALVELGFISNRPEEALMRTAGGQDEYAAAVEKAIVRYLDSNDAGSGFTEPYPRSSPAGSGGSTTGCVDPKLQ